MPLVDLDVSEVVSVAWRIETASARVWDCLTQAALLRQWLGQLVDGAVASGSEFVVDHGGGFCCQSAMLEYVEPVTLAFTWQLPGEPKTTVRMELVESEDATELKLVHSGLGELARSYGDGWCVHLSYLEAAALGTPLPISMFWRLHGTIAHLNRR